MRTRVGLFALMVATIATTAMFAPSAGAATKTPKGPYTETSSGVPDSVLGEYLEKVTNSQAGHGVAVTAAAVRGGAPPGTLTSVRYFAGGSYTTKETLTFGPSGVATGTPQPISGSGMCTSGTGIFAKVKCTFTWEGSFNELKNTYDVKYTGTFKK